MPVIDFDGNPVNKFSIGTGLWPCSNYCRFGEAKNDRVKLEQRFVIRIRIV